MLRSAAGVVAGVVVLSVVTGCASSSSEAGAGADGGKTVTVWTWTGPGKELQAAVPGFEAANPGIKVKIEDVGNPAIWDKITTGMAAGGAGLPDVMNIGVDYMPSYLEKFKDGLQDLGALGAGDLAKDFSDAAWASGGDADGKVFGVPFEEYTSVLMFRRDLFEAAGVNVDEVKTWDQLIAAGVKVKEKSGVPLLALDESATVTDSANLWQFLEILQGGFYFDGQGRVAMNDAKGVRALDLIKQMHDKGLIADVPGDIGKVFAAFAESKVAAIPAASWVPGALPEKAPALSGKVGIAPLPAVDTGGARSGLVGSSYLTLAKAGKNKDAAFKFVKYAMTDLNAQQAMFAAGGLFPANRPMQRSEGFVKAVDYYGGQAPNELIVSLLATSKGRSNYSSDYPKALRAYTAAQTQVLLKGATPKDALDKAAAQVAQQTGRNPAK
ncbi:ABC transporter substrate-binding protein [Kitasatospora sp. cg17-2]